MEKPKLHREKFEETLAKHGEQKQALEKTQAEEIKELKGEAEEEAYKDKARLEELQKEIANMTGAKESSAKPETKEALLESLKKDWQDFYKETFGIESDFSKIKIPEKQEGFDRLIIMEKGLTAQRLFDKCQELFPSEKYPDQNLDEVVVSDRNSKDQAYIIWVRDRIEADEELKNLSANQIKEKNITTETLEERLLDEIKFFKKINGYPNMKKVKTLCAGSRRSDGDVPRVFWYLGQMCVHWGYPDYHDDGLRARQVVA